MKWYSPWTWVPFTQQGRQTLVYLIFAGSGPVLTVFTAWAMYEALKRGWEAVFANLAYTVAACLLIIVTGLAMFVSIRAVRLGKDGFSAEGGSTPDRAVKPLNDPSSETGDGAENREQA